MPSKLKIYTKTGDLGTTSLYGGKRVLKSDPQVNSYGNIDELNSVIGVLQSILPKNSEIRIFTEYIQKDLFAIGAHLAGDKISLSFIDTRVEDMEKLIDKLDDCLPTLKNFILPGGSVEGALTHFARTVARRAERELVGLNNTSSFPDPKTIIYLNRLSDLLFVISRFLNSEKDIIETIWKKPS